MPQSELETTTSVSRWTGVVLRAAIGLTVVAAVGVGVASLHQRAGADASVRPPDPTPVRAEVVRLEPGYVETRRFAGRVEPARATALGFERPGRLVEVLVDEGDVVDAGAVLARLDTIELESARAELTATIDAQTAALELARLTNERQAGLTDRAVSAQRRDEARLGLAEAGARLAATEAALQRIDIDIAKSELRAPFAASVAMRSADEGAIVAPGEPVLQLQEAVAPLARIGVTEDVAATLAVGRAYALEDETATWSATLRALGPAVDAGSRTLDALFEIDADDPPPAGAIVRFAAERFHPAPGAWAPLTALTEGARGLWSVFVIDGADDGAGVRRESVRVLAVDGDRAFVAGALPDGARIVGTGAERIIPAQPVRVVASAE